MTIAVPLPLFATRPRPAAIEAAVSKLPRLVWIELTSKCPFDCIFCSRKSVRGSGEHMDIELFKSIVHQLETPETIRLNYSGESVHHPRLVEAVAIASATGAATELVTALSTLPITKIRGLVESGLGRLTVSIHALDPIQYRAIYRHSSIDELRARIGEFLRVKAELGVRTPSLDFAFVAMQRNLGELPKVAAYAREVGVRTLFVHPLIRRDPIPEPFSEELDGSQLRRDFKERLARAVEDVGNTFPGLSLSLSTEEVGVNGPFGGGPRRWTGPLPEGARILTCDQNPWETIHILSNGDVVVCEVRDKTVLGNLSRERLADVWHGEAYRDFRQRYVEGKDAACRTCPYKVVHRSSPKSSIDSRATAQLVRGFHEPDPCGHIWSKKEAVAVLGSPRGSKSFRLRGSLPAIKGRANELRVFCDGELLGRIDAGSGGQFDVRFRVPRGSAESVSLRFETEAAHRPAREGDGDDTRELGFALEHAEMEQGLRTRLARLRVRAGFAALRALERITPWLSEKWPRRPVRPLDWASGISVVIPERGRADLLGECLASVFEATRQIAEPWEVVVVVNGSPRSDYVALEAKYPAVTWVHEARPLGFTRAVRRGVMRARYGAVYLLNSDMTLEPDAFRAALVWRAPQVFAIASQIFFRDPARRREETGWTDFRHEGDRIEIYDAEPSKEGNARGGLYAGGGSSLFHRERLLAMLKDGDPYQPFYFEDAEWGVRAWRDGHEVIFCPESRAWHRHRATIQRFYPAEEIERVIERNRILFQLRNFPDAAPLSRLESTVASADQTTRLELSRVGTILGIARARVRNAVAPARDAPLRWILHKHYSGRKPDRDDLPCMLVVSPYALFPPAHGGAIRIHQLFSRLATTHRLVLLGDEATAYGPDSEPYFELFDSVHLVGGRVEPEHERGQRSLRIRNHSHAALAAELGRLVRAYRPSVVQVEYVELAGLARSGKHAVPWVLSLHDVLLTEDPRARNDDDAFEASLVSAHDVVIACSPEDAALVNHPAVRVIPNGADPERVACGNSRGRTDLLCMGPFRYRSNLDGVLAFLSVAYPEISKEFPGVTLTLLAGPRSRTIAAQHGCFGQRGVNVIEEISDPAPFLERAALTLNPLRDVRGSSIKLIESLVAGRICVSTIDGARGFRNAGFASLVLVERVEDFAAPVSFFLRHEARRLELERLPAEVMREHSWERSAGKLRDALSEVVGAR